MNKRYYIVDKDNNEIVHGYIDYDNISGFKIKPQNKVPYNGIEVGHLTLVEPELIKQVLTRKTKRKLNAYLTFLMNTVESDDDDSEALGLVLEDALRYKSIIINKYSKFLGKRYINSLLKKVNLVEKELRAKIEQIYTEEYKIGKSR